MSNNNDNFFDKIISNLRKLDGKELGKGFQKSKIKLAKDKKGAWINRMAEQYRNEEYIDEVPVDLPPPELKITEKEIIKELVHDEIRNIFGK